VLDGTTVQPWPESIASGSGPQRLVLVPANVLVQRRWLREVLEMPLEPDTLYVDGSLAAVVETKRLEAVLLAARDAGAAEVMGRLRGMFAAAVLPADPESLRSLGSADDVRGCESWLLQSLIKRNEGFMSRHVERRVSLAVTRRLVETSVTPNAMTLISVAIGLIGALGFLSPAPSWQLAGALLFLTHSILDGCDGELARLKFLESRWGAVLDFWGDNVVHVAVFAALAIQWSRSAEAAWPLIFGATAILGTLASATLMFRHTVEDSALPDAWSGRLAGALASRDFIYVVVLLSAFGHARWFLLVGSVGTPAFALLAFYLAMRRGRVR
jgi:1L-myo-inositol 1-phosphate cytidylyltransferase / CDP-L-myo-inositol myo-inositolphosphotransferase